jgi:hypothetical protein
METFFGVLQTRKPGSINLFDVVPSCLTDRKNGGNQVPLDSLRIGIQHGWNTCE